jgi:hypothetical protein
MYSLDEFYCILHHNLVAPARLSHLAFEPYGSTNPTDIVQQFRNRESSNQRWHHKLANYVLFYDQEPFLTSGYDDEFNRKFFYVFKTAKSMNILANSEHSAVKDQFIKENMLYDWYYFFHGFAALDWYKLHRHLPKLEVHPTKLFISLNNLMTRDRSYRLNLVAQLAEQRLLEQGLVSCPLNDIHGSWKDEIFSKDSRLSTPARLLIRKHFVGRTENLSVDTFSPHGRLSGSADVELQQQALFNVVTETVFYHNKLHLTEKIFKPIVARRPFMLVGAPGNLAYLKSYGFRTFDRWIDESYDKEPNPDKRIQMVVHELEKLSKLSYNNQLQLLEEMQEVLEYNFMHFYTDFKVIIINELVNNFERCIAQYNCGRIDRRINHSIDFNEVKKRMLL